MSEVNTSNVGQVTGIFIGNYEPTNKNLIWYDDTPNQMCHKVYDYNTKSWVALNPVIVAPTTYSEIVNNAKKNGLPIGKHYQITDKSNVLAVSISKTKIWYVDTLGNIIVDDLGTNIQWHVSSSNILIDDINGVFDVEKNKLIFQFPESEIDYNNDYVLGKKKSSTGWFLSKFKISSFLSKDYNNSIYWSGGIFFDFKKSINNILNKVGGIVGYDAYRLDVEKLNTSIGNVSEEAKNVLNYAKKSINEETSSDKIYNKKINRDINTTITPSNVMLGDTLFNIISKFQRWINKFKYADGISIPLNFADANSKQYINNNDTVSSAFQKIQYILKNPTTTGNLPSNWNTGCEIKDPTVSQSPYGAYQYDGFPVPGDTIFYAFAKIVDYMKGGGKYSKLSSEWEGGDYGYDISYPKAEDSIDNAISLIVGKLKRLEYIGNIALNKFYIYDKTYYLGRKSSFVILLYRYTSSDSGAGIVYLPAKPVDGVTHTIYLAGGGGRIGYTIYAQGTDRIKDSDFESDLENITISTPCSVCMFIYIANVSNSGPLNDQGYWKLIRL